LDVGAVGGACLCGALVFRPQLKKRLLKKIDETLTKALSGVPTSLKNLRIGLSGGMLKVTINDFTIGNVEGFKSETLATIHSISVVIDVKKAAKSALRSCGKHIEVEIISVIAAGCHFTYEKDSILSSNITAFMDKLKKKAEEDKGDTAAENPPEDDRSTLTMMCDSVTAVAEVAKDTTQQAVKQVVEVAREAPSNLKGLAMGSKTEKPGAVEVILHQVDITEISMEVTTTSQKESGKDGHVITLADIKVQDFGKAGIAKTVEMLGTRVMNALIQGVTSFLNAGGSLLTGGKSEDNGSSSSLFSGWGIFS